MVQTQQQLNADPLARVALFGLLFVTIAAFFVPGQVAPAQAQVLATPAAPIILLQTVIATPTLGVAPVLEIAAPTLQPQPTEAPAAPVVEQAPAPTAEPIVIEQAPVAQPTEAPAPITYSQPVPTEQQVPFVPTPTLTDDEFRASFDPPATAQYATPNAQLTCAFIGCLPGHTP